MEFWFKHQKNIPATPQQQSPQHNGNRFASPKPSPLPSRPSSDTAYSIKRKPSIINAFNKSKQAPIKYGKAGTRTERQKKLVKEKYDELYQSFSDNEIVCFTDGACR